MYITEHLLRPSAPTGAPTLLPIADPTATRTLWVEAGGVWASYQAAGEAITLPANDVPFRLYLESPQEVVAIAYNLVIGTSIVGILADSGPDGTQYPGGTFTNPDQNFAAQSSGDNSGAVVSNGMQLRINMNFSGGTPFENWGPFPLTQ